MRQQTALITGATKGIGYELVKLCARSKYDLILVSKNTEELNDIAKEMKGMYNIQVKTIAQDFSRDDAADSIYKQVKQAKMQVNVLINNAGIGIYGKFNENNLREVIDVLHVNVVQLTILTHHFIKDMLRRDGGKVLNLASTAAFQPGPLMAVYYATKAYVLSFSEAIAEELKGTNVSVTALCPGPMDAAFDDNAGMEDSRIFNSPIVINPAKVAKIGFEAMQKGKPKVTVGIQNRAHFVLSRAVSSNVAAKTVKKMRKKR